MARVSKPDALARLIKGYGLSTYKLAEIIGASQSTACRKLADPRLITYGDLQKLCRAGIPAEEIRQSIKL